MGFDMQRAGRTVEMTFFAFTKQLCYHALSGFIEW